MANREFNKDEGEKVLPSGQGSSSASGSRQQEQQSGSSGQQQATGSSARASPPPQSGSGTQSRSSNKQSEDAILQHIKRNVQQAPEDLEIEFDAEEGCVTLLGTVPDEEAAEVIIMIAGNIEGVGEVDDQMTRSGGSKSKSSQPSRGSQQGKTSR